MTATKSGAPIGFEASKFANVPLHPAPGGGAERPQGRIPCPKCGERGMQPGYAACWECAGLVLCMECGQRWHRADFDRCYDCAQGG